MAVAIEGNRCLAGHSARRIGSAGLTRAYRDAEAVGVTLALAFERDRARDRELVARDRLLEVPLTRETEVPSPWAPNSPGATDERPLPRPLGAPGFMPFIGP